MKTESSWYCLRSQPKHEHIATAHLRTYPGVEVFSPRIRFQRVTRQGKMWVTEALFPNYLFARFDPVDSQVRIRSAPGVSGIVNFGGKNARVPEETVEQLRTEFTGELRVMETEPQVGETVTLAQAPFVGLHAVIVQVLPSKQRVQVLLDFLGRMAEIEVPVTGLVQERTQLLRERKPI